LEFGGKVPYVQLFVVAEQHCPFHRVTELADIPGPPVSLQRVNRPGRDPGDHIAGSEVELSDEGSD
jgi:hypothetical protein